MIIEFFPTKNIAARTEAVSKLVIHHTATRSLPSVLSWFRDPESMRSAHYVISKEGLIYQLADPEKHITWHCKGINQQSVGIEVVSRNEPITLKQDEALEELCRTLLKKFKLNYLSISGHRSVAKSPTECPGNLFGATDVAALNNWTKEKFSIEFPAPSDRSRKIKPRGYV